MLEKKELNVDFEDEEISFEVDADVKEEFLDKQLKSTRDSYRHILKLADVFERKLGKSVYDFNNDERDELLNVQFKNKSIFAFQAVLSPLKTYVDFCISPKNLVKHNQNRFSTIITSNYKDYVNSQAVENSYIPLEKNREFQKGLANDQDKLILEYLGLGIRGRTEKGNTLEEPVNLKVEDVDFEKKVIYLTSNDGEIRHLPVDDYTLDLTKRVINQTFYVFGNGFATKPNDDGTYDKTEKGFVINPTEYVFRVPGKNKFGKADHQLFANRIQRIQKWLLAQDYLEAQYITISNLYFSAMIDFAKKIKDEKGMLEKNDYIKINENFNFGVGNGSKYIFKTREIMKIYLGEE